MTLKKLAGTWHITDMDMWSEGYFNMEVQAYIKLDQNGDGKFQFGLVRGSIVNGEIEEDGAAYDFRWEGSDEMNEASGTCYLSLTDKDQVEGEFTFDNGDTSGFQAERAKKTTRKRATKKKRQVRRTTGGAKGVN